MKQEVIVVMDRSGSMAPIRQDMEGGLRTFVEKQKKEGEAGFTLVLFDDKYEVPLEGVSLSKLDPATLHLDPRGSTALLDAVGKTIVAQGERFAKMPEGERPERVALLILTDGYENASKDWKKDQVKALIEKQQNEWKWAITFLGAGIDAFAEAGAIGIPQNFILPTSLSPKGIAASWNTVGGTVACYRSTGDLRGYTEAEREGALK